jgi:Zn-dependent protease
MAAVMYLSLLFALCVHEAAHAAMAYRCGDNTAKLLGRLSLNPLVHMDLIGTVVMPILMFTTGFPFLFGWAKPVPFNPRNLKDMRKDPVWIALAGPLSNLLMAIVTVFVARIVFMAYGGAELAPNLLYVFFQIFVVINFILLFFNMIPVPPLDGHYVLGYFLPPAGQRFLQNIGPMGIIIALIASRYVVFTDDSPAWEVIDTALEFMIGA